MPGPVDAYLKTRKARDLFTNIYVYRPLAAPIVWWLGRTSVTPNQITLASFAVAVLAAGVLVVWPGYLGVLVGVGVYCFSYVLDCADGMLARYKSLTSTAGHLFDFLMDEIKSFAVLGAVGVRLFLQARADGQAGAEGHLLAAILGLVCLSTGIAVTTFQRRPEIESIRGGAADAGASRPSVLRRAVRLAEAVAKLVIHYPSYIPLVALMDRIELYFYPYIAVNALYAARVLLWVGLRFGVR